MTISLKTYARIVLYVFVVGLLIVAGWFAPEYWPDAGPYLALAAHIMFAALFVSLFIFVFAVCGNRIKITCPLCGQVGRLYHDYEKSRFGKYTGFMCPKCGVVTSKSILGLHFYREKDGPTDDQDA